MGMIIHRCFSCHHPAMFHSRWEREGDRCSYGACPCSLGALLITDSPSELIPTYQIGTTKKVASVQEPGQRESNWRPATCGCDRCWGLFNQLVGS